MGEIDHRDFIYPGDDIVIAAEKYLQSVLDSLDLCGLTLEEVCNAFEDIEKYDGYAAAKVAAEDFKEKLEEIRQTSIIGKWDDGETAGAVGRFLVSLKAEGF